MAALRLPVSSYQRYTGTSSRLVNVYSEATREPAGKGPVLLNRIPGVTSLSTVATSGFRGGVVWNETAYAVIGNKLYSIDQAGAGTSIGTIPGTARVSLCAGTQLGIVNESGAGYTYDGSTLASISDSDFPSVASGAAMLDDFMIVFKKGSNEFNASDVSDFTSWNALSVGYARGSDDSIIGIQAGQSKLYVGGERSMEIWWNAGLSPFPFQRIPNGVLDLGLVAQHSQVIIDNSMCWYAHDGTIRILRGLTPQRISTHAVEQALAGYTNQSQAFALSMTIKGHAWYVLTIPDEATWVYDFNVGEWHERETLTYNDWKVEGYLRAYNKDLAFYAAKTGEMDEDVDDEWDTEIQGQWTYPAVYGGGRMVAHRRLEIRCDVGVGNATVTTPQITMYKSDDGGKTFDALPTRSLGAVGNYKKRVVWHRLGAAQDRVYKASMADAARLHVWDTQLEADGARIVGAR